MASTASVDSWTDSEIRTKLAELGTPVGPVTQTTRKILIKKLKRLLQHQQSNTSSPSKSRRSLASYSSGDESQGEDSNMPPPTKVRNLRRKTTGSAELTAALADSTDTVGGRQSTTERTTRGGTRRSVAGASTSKFVDTDSDSDASLPSLEESRRRTRRSEIGATNTTARQSPKPENDALLNPRTVLKSLSQFRKTTTTTTETVSPRHIIPEYRKPVLQDEEEEEEDEEEEEEADEKEDKRPVFQSNFMSRLSSGGRLSGSYKPSTNPLPEKRFSSYTSPSFSVRDSPRPSEPTYRSIFSTTTRDSLNSTVPRRSEVFDDRDRFTASTLLSRSRPISTTTVTPQVRAGPYSFFSSYLRSTKLYYTFGLLVALLAIAFIYINFGTTIYLVAIDSDKNNYPICGQEGVNTSICVEAKYLKGTMDISKVLIPRILEKTSEAYCSPSAVGETVVLPAMTDEEALIFLAEKFPSIQTSRLERDLKHFKILALSNPNWDVEVIAEGVTDINAILFNGKLYARRISLPVACHLRLWTYGFIKFVIIGAILFAIVGAFWFGLRWYKKRQETHKQDVYTMVNRILNLLTSHYEQNVVPAYVAINNCRDELIQPIQREAMSRVWEDAVNFIESNESRVRTEFHSLRGENVKVWRWVPTGGPPMSPNSSVASSGNESPVPILGRLL